MMTKLHAFLLERFLCGARKAQEPPPRAGKRDSRIIRILWAAYLPVARTMENVIVEYIYAHRSLSLPCNNICITIITITKWKDGGFFFSLADVNRIRLLGAEENGMISRVGCPLSSSLETRGCECDSMKSRKGMRITYAWSVFGAATERVGFNGKFECHKSSLYRFERAITFKHTIAVVSACLKKSKVSSQLNFVNR